MQLEDIPTVILVASGKGGVGKTTVSSDIARALKDEFDAVGLIDADISTPNSVEVVGGEGQDAIEGRLTTHDKMIAPEVNGIQIASKGIVLPDDVPVLRDGAWRAETVADYAQNVEWDDGTEVVVIDSPPGTGEELQAVASVAQPDYGIIVTTPHPSSLRDARKTHEYFDSNDLEHSAVVNMAYIPGTDIADHALDGVSFDDVQGVGDSTGEAVCDTIREQADSFPLFGYDGEALPDFPADFGAVIPYTENQQLRIDALESLLDKYTPTTEVEA